MLKSSLYVTILLFLLASCTKNEDGSDKFIVNGLRDVVVANYASVPTTLSLQIASLSGTQETVTLNITGIPANVSYSIAPANGIPSFNTIIYFTANDAIAGTYPVVINATTKSGENKNYHLNLTVTGALATTKWFLGGQLYTAPAKIVANTGHGPAVVAVDAKGNLLEVILPAIPGKEKTFRVIDYMSYYDNYFSAVLDSATCSVIVRNSSSTYYSTNNSEYITVTPVGNNNVKVAIDSARVKETNANNYIVLEGIMQTQ